MKVLLVKKQILISLVLLAIVQFSCSMGGGQKPSPTSAPIVSATANEVPTETPATQVTEVPATKSERGTPDEAKAMLQLAVEHYNTAGREQALADFNNKVSPFFDRDLYVVCMNSNHIETANGGFPQYVGVSADALSDVDGHPLGKMIWDAASSNIEGSVQYRWVNPVSGQTEPKILFFKKVSADEVCGVGAYNPQ